MFCVTVMCGKSAYDWNIRLTGRSYGGTCVISTPSIRILPEVASSNPASSLSNVDLPQPELPRIANSSLRRMSSETASTAVTPSKRFVSSWICTRGVLTGSRAPLACRAWSAVCFEPPFALSFTVGSQACLDARPQPRSQALFLRAVQVSLVQRVADFVRRVNGGVVAYLGKEERPRLAVRRRIARLVADRRDHLRSEEHTSELQSQSNLVCR